MLGTQALQGQQTMKQALRVLEELRLPIQVLWLLWACRGTGSAAAAQLPGDNESWVAAA